MSESTHQRLTTTPPTAKGIDIYGLISSHKWDAVVRMLRDHPEIASLTLNTSSGDLCLHAAVKNNAPLEVVDELFDIYPQAVSAKGQWGYLPLHHACCCGASIEVVERLIQANRSGIRVVEDDAKMLPLHLACKSGAVKGVITMLLANYPEASTAHDMYDRIPADYVHSFPDDKVRQDITETLKMANVLCVASESAREGLAHEYEQKVQELQEANASHIKSLLANHDRSKSELKKIADNRKNMELDLRQQLGDRDQCIAALVQSLAAQERKFESLLKMEKDKVIELEGHVESLGSNIATKISEYDELQEDKKSADENLAKTKLELKKSLDECACLRCELADRDGRMDNINNIIANFRKNPISIVPAPAVNIRMEDLIPTKKPFFEQGNFVEFKSTEERDGADEDASDNATDATETSSDGSDGPEMSTESDKEVKQATIEKNLETPTPLEYAPDSSDSDISAVQLSNATVECE